MKPVVLSAILVAAASLAGTAAAEEWNPFSRNARLVYLADVGAITGSGDVTSIRVARVAMQGPSDDYSHKIDEYAIRCGAKQARIVMEIDFGPDGAELDRYPDAEAAWDDIRPNSLASFVQAIACDGARADGANAPSIKTFIDSGRGH